MIDFFHDDPQGSATLDLTRESIIDTQDRIGTMLDAMPIGVLIHSMHAILYANESACAHLGDDRQSLYGRHFLDFLRADQDTDQFHATFSATEATIDRESVIVAQDGGERLVRVISGRLPWDGLPVVQILIQDITDQKRAENSLRKLTITDELTGAYNRRHAFYEAALHLGETGDRSADFATLLVDVDHFKAINDTYGHAAGDTVLRALATAGHRFLATSKLDSAIFARFGGEEFLMLMPGIDERLAMRLGEQFRAQVEQLAVETAAGPISFSISVGITGRRAGETMFEALLARADKALYCAKRRGRNLVVLAD